MLVAAALAVGAAFGGLMYKAWEKNRGDRELQLAEEAASRDHERHDRERSADLKVVDASRTASGKNWVYMAAVENFGAAAAEKDGRRRAEARRRADVPAVVRPDGRFPPCPLG